MSEVAKPTISMTFYAIAEELTMYFDTLALCETDEQRTDVQAQIERLGADLSRKADSIAGVLRRMDTEIGFRKVEEERLRNGRKTIERAEAWLKEYVASVMQKNGMLRISGDSAKVSLRVNGGVEPLKITEELSDAYKDITVRMPATLFEDICGICDDQDVDLRAKVKQIALEPSQDRIRETLERSQCANCGGAGKTCPSGPIDAPMNTCADCGGTGKGRIPGARLEPRGQHIRIT